MMLELLDWILVNIMQFLDHNEDRDSVIMILMIISDKTNNKYTCKKNPMTALEAAECERTERCWGS